ncbi:hypothetical protein DSC45_34710 [Streptomyces sp. YIM 130001]|nr:hypothetical protein DSC45_34710 [Streptomyces sp. YIM 130001]
MGARATYPAERSQRDAAVEVLISLCGWLVAAVFVVGCVPGWWWGGDLARLPVIGESASAAASERRGWPWVPVLTMVCGGLLVRRVWLAVADGVRGVDPRGRYQRRSPRIPAGDC